MESQAFHSRCGQLISLSPDGRGANRDHASQEFNHGLVFSAGPLADDQIFEIRIDRKIDSWSGSLEVGVTTCDPDSLDDRFPSSANEMRSGSSWIFSGSTLRVDGKSVVENYGPDLDQVEEGDRVGVVRTSQGDLVFFVNGISQSVAASGVPGSVWAVVDLYGKCAAVTITDPHADQEARIIANAISNEATAAAAAASALNVTTSKTNETNRNIAAMTRDSPDSCVGNRNLHKIRFHEQRGLLVRLTNGGRTAERKRPFDEFNHGVVMTHRPIEDDELFELRIDRLVDKWSGSIEVGMTTHGPDSLEFPSTMTNQRSGTMMMSGCGILTNGKGTRRKYGDFNLDELTEGDRIGLMRRGGGDLHFYINGLDQGVAATRVPSPMWGVVDLYGMTAKVTIVDRDEREEHNLMTRRNFVKTESLEGLDHLKFHPKCGSHAAVISSGFAAHRPNATDDFNFGVVLTNRPLKPNEVFEVRLDKMVTKWAGSIEIGLTTHGPDGLEFPSTMTNIRSGTWMMTGNGVMHNGTTVIDDYGINLDKLKVGDRVAVVRKDNGTVHFFVNSEDQGPAASNVPETVYGVIDLYGQAAQATIVGPDHDESDGSTTHSTLLDSGDLRFHHLHGRNARISNNGLSASRPHALGEFNDAIVMSNRPLRDGEMFEMVIERMVERWSGAIEAGVTSIRPEDLEFPSTMTDIDYDTWMLSGSAVMRDGQTILNGYCCDLDRLTVGSRLGMVRTTDGTLRYTINGEDQGIACHNIPANVYAVVDLYGQCAQVSIIQQAQMTTSAFQGPSLASSQIMESSHISLGIPPEISSHRLSPGPGIELKNNSTTVSRLDASPAYAYSSAPFVGEDETFEIRLDETDGRYAGSLKLGLTSVHLSIHEHKSKRLFGPSENGETLWLDDSTVYLNSRPIRTNYCLSLDRLVVGDRLGLKRHSDGVIRFLVNGEECSPIHFSSRHRMWPVVELYGSTVTVSVVSLSTFHQSPSFQALTAVEEPGLTLGFHDNHGRNVQIKDSLIAVRTDSYNQGIVIANRPLGINELFKVKIDSLNQRWSSSLSIGVIGCQPDNIHLPVTALGFKKNSVILSGDGGLYVNGQRTVHGLSVIESLPIGAEVGVSIDKANQLHLHVNGRDHGVMLTLDFSKVYGVVDLYGKCDQVSLVPSSGPTMTNEETAIPIGSQACCNYYRQCLKFRNSLCIPHQFMDSDESSGSCFCPACHPNGETYAKKGDPEKEYALPVGWVRFPITHKGVRQVQNQELDEEGPIATSRRNNWHRAYHGSKPSCIRKMLDLGELVPMGELGLEGTHNLKRSKKEDGSDAAQLLFSPTLKYTEALCPLKTFKKEDKVRVAFEVDVHPGSYKVGPPTTVLPSSVPPENVDRHFKPDELEWLTKERGNTAITALLIKIE